MKLIDCTEAFLISIDIKCVNILFLIIRIVLFKKRTYIYVLFHKKNSLTRKLTIFKMICCCLGSTANKEGTFKKNYIAM